MIFKLSGILALLASIFLSNALALNCTRNGNEGKFLPKDLYHLQLGASGKSTPSPGINVDWQTLVPSFRSPKLGTMKVTTVLGAVNAYSTLDLDTTGWNGGKDIVFGINYVSGRTSPNPKELDYWRVKAGTRCTVKLREVALMQYKNKLSASATIQSE